MGLGALVGDEEEVAGHEPRTPQKIAQQEERADPLPAGEPDVDDVQAAPTGEFCEQLLAAVGVARIREF